MIETYALDVHAGALTSLPDRSMKTPGFAGGTCVSPDGNLLLAVSVFSDELYLFDLQTCKIIGQTDTGPMPYDVGINPEGDEACVSCEKSDEVDFFDISDPTDIHKITTLPTQKNPEALWVDPGGSRLYVTSQTTDGNVAVLDVVYANGVSA